MSRSSNNNKSEDHPQNQQSSYRSQQQPHQAPPPPVLQAPAPPPQVPGAGGIGAAMNYYQNYYLQQQQSSSYNPLAAATSQIAAGNGSGMMNSSTTSSSSAMNNGRPAPGPVIVPGSTQHHQQQQQQHQQQQQQLASSYSRQISGGGPSSGGTSPLGPPPPPPATGGYAAAFRNQQPQPQLQAPPPPPPPQGGAAKNLGLLAPSTQIQAVTTTAGPPPPPPPPTTTRSTPSSMVGQQLYQLQSFNSLGANLPPPLPPMSDNRPPPPAPPAVVGQQAPMTAQLVNQQQLRPAIGGPPPPPPPPPPAIPTSSSSHSAIGGSLPHQAPSSAGAPSSLGTQDSSSKRGKRGREDVDHSDADEDDRQQKKKKEKKKKEKRDKRDKEEPRGDTGNRNSPPGRPVRPMSPAKNGEMPDWVTDVQPESFTTDGSASRKSANGSSAADRLSGKMSFHDSDSSLRPETKQVTEPPRQEPKKLIVEAAPAKSPVKQPQAKIIAGARISPIPARKTPPAAPATSTVASKVISGIPRPASAAITVPTAGGSAQQSKSKAMVTGTGNNPVAALGTTGGSSSSLVSNTNINSATATSSNSIIKVSDALGNSVWRYNPAATAPSILKSSMRASGGGAQQQPQGSGKKKQGAGPTRRCVFASGVKFNKRFTSRYTCVDESFGTQAKPATTTAGKIAPRAPAGTKLPIPSVGAGKQNDSTTQQQQALAKRKPGTFINEEFSDMRMRQFVSLGSSTETCTNFWTGESQPLTKNNDWITKVKSDRSNKRNVKDLRRLPEKDGLTNKGSDLLGLWIPGGTVSAKTYLGIPFFKKIQRDLSPEIEDEEGEEARNEPQNHEQRESVADVAGVEPIEEGDAVPPVLDHEATDPPTKQEDVPVDTEDQPKVDKVEEVDPATVDPTLIVEGASGLIDVSEDGGDTARGTSGDQGVVLDDAFPTAAAE